jgi:ABC-type transport system involved in cytochrome c biogenesis permease subunit
LNDLIWAPNEAEQGTTYRIIYFHVPMGILSFVAAYLLGFAGIMFLVKRDLKWDRLAIGAAELGVLCSACSLITFNVEIKTPSIAQPRGGCTNSCTCHEALPVLPKTS